MRARGSVAIVLLLCGCGSRTAVEMFDASAPAVDAAPVVRDALAREDAPAPPCSPRRVRIAFTPTARAQLAVAIEDDGARFATIALTEAVALRGIGNRPGAMQTNSGFRWPYGRREGALPYWAHRRIERGGAPFPRVIFGERPEGHVGGGAGRRGTPDEYFCLPFTGSSGRDSLDAISCASPFYGDKGRFITAADVEAGYAEPFEIEGGAATMRALGRTSAYPPRRDLVPHRDDHPDVASYASAALAAMPELDAVTMATPRGDAPVELFYDVDASWPDGTYAIVVEANTEGDYGGAYDPSSLPTPTKPPDAWDAWSAAYGYPYRGQPSVVFRIEIEIAPGRAATYRARGPIGHMDPHGLDASIAPMDESMIDDPITAPGSGADRLRVDDDGARLTVETRCL